MNKFLKIKYQMMKNLLSLFSKRFSKMYQILYLFIWILGFCQFVNGQILRFGSKLDGSGNLIMVDTIFHLNTLPQVIYAKLFSKTPLLEDSLIVVVKNLHLTNRFVMKRSANKMHALATLKFKEDGIYKIFVINPKTKQTVASKKLYITSAVNPNVQALKNDYQKQLVAKNQAKNPPNVSNNTAQNSSPKNTVNKPNNTTVSNNNVKTNNLSDDYDFDDIDNDDIDTDIDPGTDVDLDVKDDDLSDFDDAD